MQQNLKQGILEEVFDLPPQGNDLQVIEGEVVSLESLDPTINKRIEDSNYIRQELKDIINNTKDALDLALQEQMNNPDPKSSTAVAQLSDTLTKTLQTLMNLAKIEADRELEISRNTKTNEPTSITNNLLVLNTSDLIAEIMKKNKELK